jgi:hypothetical protein
MIELLKERSEQRIFFHIYPIFQSDRTSHSKEYHIYYTVEDTFEQTFLDDTKIAFFDVVIDYAKETYKNHYITLGHDYNHDRDGCRDYIWLHLKDETAKNDIQSIITDLNHKYNRDWSKYRVPKLLSIIKSILTTDPEYLAQSVSHHQEVQGYKVTQDVLYIVFNDIID